MERLLCEIILGANIRIAKFGTKVGANPISELVAPAPPSGENSGAWIDIGKIRSAKPQTDYKTADVEGVDDSGVYRTTEMRIATKRKFQFSTNDVSPEALQLTFGLRDAIVDATEQVPFAAAADEISCWLHFRLRDSYRNGTELATMMLPVKLHLVNPVSIASDPALIEWEATIIPSSLSEFNPVDINKAAQS